MVDGNGKMKRKTIRAINIFSLPLGERIVVEWNSMNHAIEFLGGILSQFLGHITSNCENFPIGYNKTKDSTAL